VDDDADARRLNTKVLTRHGYRVDVAEDWVGAWNALQLNNYDLLVTDNNRPSLSGVGLLRNLQAVGFDMPVIMATGTVPEEAFNLSARFQPVVTLIKPYTFDELVAAVGEVLRSKRAALKNLFRNWSTDCAERILEMNELSQMKIKPWL
jgi:OmpR-family two-component system manganese-sensing response regulator